ncbi:MAG: S1 family peptidase [Labilithrix sp.]|nr:S1 family peptidase [Labilithrix sp.]
MIGSASAGCAAEAAEPVEANVVVGTSEPTIFGGSKDDDQESLPGVVALRVGTGGTFELCSGALVAPNVVLTARHCVTQNLTTSISCDENGQSANGEHVKATQDPAAVGVYLGATPSFAKAPISKARAIVAPSGKYLCDSDIALVVLDRNLDDVPTLPLRIHSPARAGEKIRSVGYGQNDKSVPIGTRFRKDGVPVLAQGKAVSASKTPLGPHEFEVGKSICQGDSGGPAISEATGAVIGVVSRGGKCDEDFGHIYTTTAGFEDLFEQAFELAKSEPTLEPGDAEAGQARARSKAASPMPSEESTASAGGCAISGATHTNGRSASALVGLAVAIAAVRARRRVDGTRRVR